MNYCDQDSFKEALIKILKGDLPDDLLDKIVAWLGSNLSPEDIFSKERLLTWISENYAPEEVFTAEALNTWADENYTNTEDYAVCKHCGQLYSKVNRACTKCGTERSA